MSISYFILNDQNAEWRIQPESFLQALKQRWPLVERVPISNPEDPYLLEWVIPLGEEGYIRGLVDKGLQSVVLRGSGGLEGSALFAVWFQQIYPEQKHFIFLDEQASFDVDLAGRTAEEIVQLANQGYSFLRPELNESEEAKA